MPNKDLRKQVKSIIAWSRLSIYRKATRDVPENHPIDETVDQLLDLITKEKIALLREIAASHYDDMHQTYDYDGIAEEVLERALFSDVEIAALKKESK